MKRYLLCFKISPVPLSIYEVSERIQPEDCTYPGTTIAICLVHTDLTVCELEQRFTQIDIGDVRTISMGGITEASLDYGKFFLVGSPIKIDGQIVGCQTKGGRVFPNMPFEIV